MKRAEMVLWIASAVLAIAVTVACLRGTPGQIAASDAYESATLSLDEHGVVAFKVNLNTAEQVELMRLPGMSAETAQAILAYRAYYGRFVDVREIGNVKGVTEEMRDRWVPYLTLDTESSH